MPPQASMDHKLFIPRPTVYEITTEFKGKHWETFIAICLDALIIFLSISLLELGDEKNWSFTTTSLRSTNAVSKENTVWLKDCSH